MSEEILTPEDRERLDKGIKEIKALMLPDDYPHQAAHRASVITLAHHFNRSVDYVLHILYCIVSAGITGDRVNVVLRFCFELATKLRVEPAVAEGMVTAFVNTGVMDLAKIGDPILPKLNAMGFQPAPKLPAEAASAVDSLTSCPAAYPREDAGEEPQGPVRPPGAGPDYVHSLGEAEAWFWRHHYHGEVLCERGVRCEVGGYNLVCRSFPEAVEFFREHGQAAEADAPDSGRTREGHISPSLLRSKYQQYIDESRFFPDMMKPQAKTIIYKGFAVIAEALGVIELTYRRTMAIEAEKQEKEADG